MSKPRRMKPESDEEAAELWVVGEDESRQVLAGRYPDQEEWPWEVYFAVAEFIREEPLESELNGAIHLALSAVRGVRDVVHEDREKWLVSGRPRGKALVTAGAQVLDRFGPRIDQALLFDN